MSETINSKWLKDEDNNKIAPKTFVSQVLTDDGTKTLSSVIGNVVHIADDGGEYAVGASALYTNDVVNNLTSDVTDKPLSAKQGKILASRMQIIVSATAPSDTSVLWVQPES